MLDKCIIPEIKEKIFSFVKRKEMNK